jgi:long-chain acyl-CoA synthetase
VRHKREQLVTELPSGADVLKFVDLLRSSSGRPPRVSIAPAHDLALLQYTGGTTGLPKGAMLTHRNLVANAHQTASWDPAMRRGEETVLAALPMFHVYGLTLCLTVNALMAGTLVLLPTFDLTLLFKAIDKFRPTVFPGVPPMYDLIVRSRRTTKHDLRSIRTCVSGAMRLPPVTVEKFENITGGHLVEGYGLTESSPVALANPLNRNARPGTIGLPLPSTDVRVANLDDPTRDVAVDEPGELCVRGPQVFAGYWRQPEDTASMLRDGWLHTGDIAVMDPDGFVTIVDRLRDVILASGFSIFPSEIEDVLTEHPAIEECAVVGVPHFYRGETVKAYIVLRAGQRADEDELRRFCSARLVAYKVPAQFDFRHDLPRNLLGKVLRRVLRAEHEAMRAGLTLNADGFEPESAPTAVLPPIQDVAPTAVPPAVLPARPVPVAAPPPAAPAGPPASSFAPSVRASAAARTSRPAPAPRHAVPDEQPQPNGHVVGTDGLVDELERLARLRDAGALTESEFGAAKARLLQDG